MNMKSNLSTSSLRTLVIVLALMTFPFVAQAQSACPGASNMATGASAIILGSTAAHSSFVGAGCVTAMVGGANAPAACNEGNATFAFFQALWSATTLRTASSNAGCSFVCNAGANTCFVRAADGLPVELLEFSVKDAD